MRNAPPVMPTMQFRYKSIALLNYAKALRKIREKNYETISMRTFHSRKSAPDHP